MVDRWNLLRRQRRYVDHYGDRISVSGCRNIRLRPSSMAMYRNNAVDDIARKLSLALFCFCVVSHQIGSEVYSASAFSIFRSQSFTSTLLPSSTSAGPMSSPTTLFLFSMKKNSKNDEDINTSRDSVEKENGTTTTIEKTAGWNADDESQDFSAWMEELKLGTPLGKMTSSSPALVTKKNDSELVRKSDSNPKTSPAPTKVISSVSLRDSKSKTDSVSTRSSSSGSSSGSGSSSSSTRLESTGRPKINPLSNLIQFEAMLELAKISKNKDANEKLEIDVEAGSSSATDIFAVVDRLVKTFQKQEEDKQTGQKELLKLVQLEKKVDAEGILVKDKNNGKGDGVANAEEVSTDTTVKDLMELDRYVGSLPLPKVSSIWDIFNGKDESVVIIDDDIGEDDTNQSLIGPASSSPLFRIKEPKDPDITSSSTKLAQAAESILKDTTNKMEYLVAEASSAILDPYDEGISKGTSSSSSTTSTSALKDLVGRASSVFNSTAISPTAATSTTTSIVESISNDIVGAAQKIAAEYGVEFNVQFAADRAREATEFAVGVAATANMVLDVGYAYGSRSGAAGTSGRDDDLNYLAASAATQTAESVFSPSGDGSISEGTFGRAPTHQPPLFGDFASAQRIEPHEYENVVILGAEMGCLAGAVYVDPATRCHDLGHSLVANGTTANVAWMVTDSVMDREHCASAFRHHDDAISETEGDFQDTSSSSSSGPVMIRTITMRGFDASDESSDREALLNDICFATADSLDDATADKVVFHKGLLKIAREIYAETKKYIDWASPDHKIVFNGHSVGGSLSILMLLLVTSERGADYARDRILRAYSHGCPPVATLANNTIAQPDADEKFSGTQRCPVLEAFDLPPSMVYGFIQPYDPVIRLFSNNDVLYPLVDDLGKDGITLYSTGPIRSLRPITRAIFQAWDGWPQFRDNWKGTCDMQYHSIGIQHILMPEPVRYLNDRFISVNVGIPPVDAIVRISGKDLLPALDQTFPLDTFQVSLVPQAVRSFLHHFYPAYEDGLSDYATRVKDEEKEIVEEKSGAFKPDETT